MTHNSPELLDALRAACERAVNHVADVHDVQPNEVHGRPALRAAVVRETLAVLPYVPGFAEALSEAFMPRQCARESCVNDAVGSGRWCGPACRQWGKRKRSRVRDAAA